MPVYPVLAGSARCAASGCRCHDRVRAYPSDTTDAQWAVLEPEARAVMAGLVKAEGRPMEHDLRAMTDAAFYVVKNGVEWRALPVDFPPHAAVWKFFGRWSDRGLPEALTHRLRGALREWQGRAAQPTAVIVDSQIVKAADTVGKATRGFHGGKKINGRGRHAARPVGLQPAGARQPAGHDRHAADRRPDPEPARCGVPDQGLGERRALVHRPRADPG
jgi:transposase